MRKNAEDFEWENQWQFAKEIASAILWLHDHEIVHGDLVGLNYILRYFVAGGDLININHSFFI